MMLYYAALAVPALAFAFIGIGALIAPDRVTGQFDVPPLPVRGPARCARCTGCDGDSPNMDLNAVLMCDALANPARIAAVVRSSPAATAAVASAMRRHRR